ncbi:phosphate acetyltransferase [Candidatus Peregrinibacteria bacterium]|nr:phosphate acetyltransferase [Candidatus Peregrinibacteria bacterium]
MNKFLRKVRAQARKNPKRIVYPEGTEERILRCTEEVLKQKIAKPILLGSPKIIRAKAKKLNLEIDWKNVEIIDQNESKLTKEFANTFFELRKDKGVTKNQAAKIVKDINYFGTMMVHLNYADGMVTGTTFPTDDSIRPALQIIKTKEKFHKVSGVFFMIFENRLLLFADAAITISPEAHDLVDIAKDTAETAKRFGIKPKVAMLSFSTKGSADHPFVDKVKSAVAMLKDEEPSLIVDGELQVDAAIVPAVAERKCPKSPLKGEANILIFPSLEAANIAYKLVERLAKAKAIGPILQGLKKPVNDLSRGCHYQDIVNVTAFTVCECQENKSN